MKHTYILIHGAWHGGWSWSGITPRLQAAGHIVYTPDLPGHYNNPCNFASVNMAKYAESIEQLMQTIGTDVILVGHSMGGAVISQVAENRPQQIKNLVYVAGFVLEDGGSITEEAGKMTGSEIGPELEINVEESYIAINHSPKLRELFYEHCSDADFQYAIQSLQHQPMQPFSDKIKLTERRFGSVPKTYIECIKDNAIPIADQRRMYASIDCDIVTLDTDHSPFFSDKEGLMQGLLLA